MFLDESAYFGVANVEAEDNGVSDFHEAMMVNVAENESNFNSLMRPCILAERAAIVKGEAPASVWTEGAISNFWAKAKAFFLKLLAKIKGVFNRFMSFIAQHIRGGKSFFDKYKKQLADKFAKIDKDKVKFVGYTFKNLEKSPVADGLRELDSDDYGLDKDKVDEMIEGYRASLVGQSGTLSASEFSKELKEYFCGDSKEEMDVSYQDIVRALGNADKAKKTVQNNYKGLESAVNKIIHQCEKNASSATDDLVKDRGNNPEASAKTAGYPTIIAVYKGMLAAAQQFIGAQMRAAAAEVSQYKGFAGQVLRASVKESAGFDESGNFGANDFFGNVEFH